MAVAVAAATTAATRACEEDGRPTCHPASPPPLQKSTGEASGAEGRPTCRPTSPRASTPLHQKPRGRSPPLCHQKRRTSAGEGTPPCVRGTPAVRGDRYRSWPTCARGRRRRVGDGRRACHGTMLMKLVTRNARARLADAIPELSCSTRDTPHHNCRHNKRSRGGVLEELSAEHRRHR